MPLVMEALYVSLGRHIQQIRQQRRLTQEQLGGRLTPQVTRASIANIEAGKQRVLVHTLVQIADALEVTLDDLIKDVVPDQAEELEKHQQVEAELQERLRLSPEELQRLSRKLGLSDGEIAHNASTNTKSDSPQDGGEPD